MTTTHIENLRSDVINLVDYGAEQLLYLTFKLNGSI